MLTERSPRGRCALLLRGALRLDSGRYGRLNATLKPEYVGVATCFEKDLVMLLPKVIDPVKVEIPHLVTIPYSHYCELGRWAMDHQGDEYVEIKYAPGTHAKYVGQLRKDRSNRSESSFVGQESGVHGGRRKYAVPLLCLPGGTVLKDSWEILERACGAPAASWKTCIDQELGIAVRQLAYYHLLDPTTSHLISEMIRSASLYERVMWRFIGDKVMDGMKQLMAVTTENAVQGEAQVLEILDTAGKDLERYGGALQEGGGFGATEIAFCSIASIAVLPENWANGAASLPDYERVSPGYRAFIDRCRATRAGEFIMDQYRERRSKSAQN